VLTTDQGIAMTEALDKQMIMTGPVHGQFKEISMKLNYKIMCSQVFNSDQMELVYYIPESLENKREVLMLIQMLKGEKVSGIWNIRFGEEENSDLKIISDFIKVPSAVLDTIFVYHGNYFAYMRFNNSDLEKVSKIMLENVALDEEYSVESLDETKGTLSNIKNISEEIPLFVINVISDPPAKELEPHNNPMGKTWKRIIKSLSPDDLISAVYVTDESVSIPEFPIINEEMHMYLGSVRNPLLVHLNREFNEKGIVTFSRIQSINNGLFTMSFIISADQVSQAIRIMGKMFSLFPEWNCRISFASRLEDATEEDLLVV